MSRNKLVRHIIPIAIVCICLLGICYLVFINNMGVKKDCIEADARSFQNIPDTWSSQSETGDTLSALIFYPNDSSDAVYSIYLKRGGVSFGYFFRAGGKVNSVKNGITRFSVDGYSEFAYISLNKQGICKLVIDDGDGISVMELDSSSPFAIVLPSNSGNVYFYNEKGATVEYSVSRI